MEFDEQPQEFNVDFGEVTRSGGGGGAVNSVNGKTGDVVLDAEDVGALPNSTVIPTKTSELENDGAAGDSSYVETGELASVATSGKYTDLTDTPTIPSTASDVGALPDSTKYGKSISASGTTLTLKDQNGEDLATATTQDTTYSNFTGTDGQTAGASGLVPAPATTDADKFLKSDGSWATAGGGGGGPTVVQTTGTSQTDVMSQKAVTDTIFANNNSTQVRIGTTNSVGANSVTIGSSAAQSNRSVAIGASANSSSSHGICIGMGWSNGVGAVSIGGHGSSNDGALSKGAVAIGYGSKAENTGEMNVGSTDSSYGYNSTNYRLISGVYDGQAAHDVATVGQINALIDAINTAAGTNISHIGS